MTNTQNGVRYEIRNNLVGKYYTQEIVFGHCYQLNLQLIWSAVFPLNISFSVHIRPHCIVLSWGCLGKTKSFSFSLKPSPNTATVPNKFTFPTMEGNETCAFDMLFTRSVTHVI